MDAHDVFALLGAGFSVVAVLLMIPGFLLNRDTDARRLTWRLLMCVSLIIGFILYGTLYKMWHPAWILNVACEAWFMLRTVDYWKRIERLRKVEREIQRLQIPRTRAREQRRGSR